MSQIISTNTFTTAKWIVSATASDGTHTTIAAALTSASSGDTIFIRPGTYTENLTLKVGVNLAAYDCDALTPNVTISGTCTLTTAGTVSISGIRLQTNSAAAIAVTGSAASILQIKNCYLNFTNTTGITFSASNTAAAIYITDCRGDLGTTGIALFTHTSTGLMQVINTLFSNSGGSSTASTCSSGTIDASFSQFTNPITTSSTGAGTWEHCVISTVAQNATSATLGGGSLSCKWCRFQAGSASALSIGGASVFLEFCDVASSNTNAITGAGTLTYSPITFSGSSSTVNTSVQTPFIIGPKIYTTGGITFDNSSTLNIFSQGTFSPTIIGAGTAGTVAMGTQVGRYQKVGRIATVSIYCSWTTIGTATGAVLCNNLPFTVANNADAIFAPSLVQPELFTLATTATAVPFMVGVTNATQGKIQQCVGGPTSTAAGTTITASNGFTTQFIYETT